MISIALSSLLNPFIDFINRQQDKNWNSLPKEDSEIYLTQSVKSGPAKHFHTEKRAHKS